MQGREHRSKNTTWEIVEEYIYAREVGSYLVMTSTYLYGQKCPGFLIVDQFR